jgi:1-acyl-sn-glycerol-3-phosphate acyltransferase
VTWSDGAPPPDGRLGPLGWALALLRLTLIAVVIYSLMVFLLIARLIETPFGRRPVSPAIVQLASRLSLGILRLPVKVHGTPMRHRGAVVSNHCSWLDIFSLNAVARVYFVSKAEVSAWPVIGQVARAAGTVFIERKASHAARQKTQFEERLLAGDRLLFFPEGTSTDGLRVLPFKSTLFAAFFAPDLRATMWIQPASLIYHAPKGEDPRFFGWWGEMEFGPHFLKTLGAPRAGRIEVVFHDPVAVSQFRDRKALTAHCEKAVREGLARVLGPDHGAVPTDGS